MLAHAPDEKTLRKDIYKLRRELRKDIAEVEEAAKVSSLIPTTAISKMKKLEKEMRAKPVSKLNKGELQSLYRKIKYIRDLKSSTLEGAEITAQKFSPIKYKLEVLSQNQREKWWDIYGELYKTFSGYENFKYEIFQLIDEHFGTIENERILNEIISTYENILEDSGGMKSDEEVKILFTNRLRTLFK